MQENEWSGVYHHVADCVLDHVGQSVGQIVLCVLRDVVVPDAGKLGHSFECLLLDWCSVENTAPGLEDLAVRAFLAAGQSCQHRQRLIHRELFGIDCAHGVVWWKRPYCSW